MQALSVVIVCKNEEDVIADTLRSLLGLTDDVIVFDNGSTDQTVSIVERFNVRMHHGAWEGFGKTKMKALSFAKYDWILSLDADEAIDEELKQALLSLQLNDNKEVYELKFKNFFGSKYLKYGEWGSDRHIRLFNRKTVSWNDAPVHEQLTKPNDIVVKKLKGFVLHRTARNVKEYASKMTNYAMLNAKKYYQQGRKASWLMLGVAPAFSFINNYIFKLGFLDGHAGYLCARITGYYTFLKYARLRELNNQKVDPKAID